MKCWHCTASIEPTARVVRLNSPSEAYPDGPQAQVCGRPECVEWANTRDQDYGKPNQQEAARDNVTDFPQPPKRDLITEMTGAQNLGNAVVIEGREVPNMVMFDRRPERDEIEFCLDHRVMFGFPSAQAWDAAAFAFAAMAFGAGCDPLNFEPRPFAKKIVKLDLNSELG